MKTTEQHETERTEMPSHVSPSEQPAPARRTSRALIVAAVATALAVGAVVGFVVNKYMGSSGPTEVIDPVESPQPTATSPAPDGHVITLDARQIQRIRLETVDLRKFHAEKLATGRIAFNEDFMTPVFSPYAGRVLHLIAKPGDAVKLGAPLLDLYTPDLVQAESDLIAAASTVAKAKTALNLGRRTEERQHQLYLDKAAALKDWEQAQSDLQNAESDLRAAEASLLAAHDRLRVFGKSDADIARVEREHTIDRVTTVGAPIAGTITTRKVGPGQYIRPDNADPLFIIADLSKMWMLANVYEADVPLIKVGQPVEVSVAAYPSEVFKASISHIGAAVDPGTHRVDVRAVVENHEQKLKPEMFATFRITTDADVQALAVPLSAIVREGEKTSVWVAQGANQFARREVTMGLEQEDYVQILSGLQAGEEVVAEEGLLLSGVEGSS
jgi:cobalt-zinc-cadmium efflux system membrane fusion protein